MKILFASASFSFGGITSYAREVINNFSKDNDFSVLIGDDSYAPITNIGVKVYKYESSKLTVANAKVVIALINNEIKPELVLSNNAHLISLVAPYLNNDINIVTISHSLKYSDADMAAVSHKYIDGIIAASSIYNKEYMEKRFGIKDKNKIKIIWNFVAPHPDSERLREAKKTNYPLNIVFTGGCAGSKTPELVLNVLYKLIESDLNFRFYWIGNTNIHINRHFPFYVARDIRTLIPEDERVIVTGRLKTREDVMDLYSKANIFFTPSRREGCPMALIEAIRVGVISVVADYKNANREIIQDGYNGFVLSHKNVKAFVNRISDIIKNHSSYLKIYDNSYETYISSLSYPVWKSNMENYLYGVSNNHKNRYKRVNSLRLFLDVIRLKLLFVRDTIEVTIEEDFRVLFKLTCVKHFGLLKGRKTILKLGLVLQIINFF